MGELSETTKEDIRARLASMTHGGPLVLIVVSNDHSELLDNWLCHMDALGIHRLLIVAMDDTLFERLSWCGLAVVRGVFDGSASDFWLQRAIIWSFLADQGIEFIHSDTDAVWLRDPIPHYAHTQGDVLFSQGTILPKEAIAAWRFVLCCGFFWARPTPPTRALMRALVDAEATHQPFHDQAALNRLLVSAGTHWAKDTAASYPMQHCGVAFDGFSIPLNGTCQRFGLRVVLLPHHQFPRLQPGAPDAMVRHVLRTGDPDERIGLMRDAGCWRLDAYPNGFAFAR